LIASQPVFAGELLVECSPMAAVLKAGKASPGMSVCAQCFASTPAVLGPALCSPSCAFAYSAGGGAMLERVDLSDLQELHRSQGRKFPLLIAQLLAGLLAQIKAGNVPSQWAPLELCFAEMEPEAMPQIEAEYSALCSAFEASGLTNRSTLQVLLPLNRYARLLGAAQLNAFELRTSTDLAISCLMPPMASCFNHSCAPNVLVACGDSARSVAFVAGDDVAPGEELCISYVDTESSGEERRHLLLHKYGFRCPCVRCSGEEVNNK
jgi:SET and MYND domain-containing protein